MTIATPFAGPGLLVRRTLRMVPHFDRLYRQDERLYAPPGHWNSPIPEPAEVLQTEAWRAQLSSSTVPGVNLNSARQVELLAAFAAYYPGHPFPEQQQAGRRYWFDNESFSYGDALALHCMLRHLRPRRLIEVGSGFSSAVILDTNAQCLDNRIACTFVEPYPERVTPLLLPGDTECVTLLTAKLQDVPLDVFRSLEAGDVLFIDSTHIAKTGSDVNHVLFEVLPVLAHGVRVHFHDVFYPFEYPEEWICERRAWNEAYLLRAFLMYNSDYVIEFFNDYLARFHRDALAASLPWSLRNSGGSIWLRKV